ncbi:cysteine proteinase [Sporormia fimetaria CBS 119925]|uniref:Cysteine proteinase n=1 Tax=Sporormia fimetaria CBS 119925 TaxID=1340428 RepID=A0A6A6VGC4_9PLEO|nr:cysteine proteinase [Sporormia fimetaria CBS 119925]
MSRIKDRVRRHFGDNLAPDDAYLSYYDVRLTKLDVDSIKNDWLTDNAIAFWQEYLEREHLSNHPRAKIILLRPTMAFMLRTSPDLSIVADALPDLRSATHIFLPINDNSDVTQASGGSHWSLLLVSLIDGVAFSYDSLHSSNYESARDTAEKLEQLVGRKLKFLALNEAPQQENGSDCGVFVCLNMKHLLLKRLLKYDANEKVAMSVDDRDIRASEGRKEMLRIVEERRREGERRRS